MKTRRLVLTSLFVAIGVVLPQALHLFGGPTLGSILLPMHLPAFIGAMLLGAGPGIIIALLSVGIGVLLGMPSLVIASYMVFELIAYAAISGYLYQKKHWNVFLSFGIAKLFGMSVAIVMVLFWSGVLGITYPPTFGTITMFAVGIPGIIAQAILVPTVVLVVKQRREHGHE